MKDKVAVITGGAQGIGKALVQGFQRQGDTVSMIDKRPSDSGASFVGDVGKEKDLRRFAEQVISTHGKVDFLINNAMLTHGGLADCSYDQFNEVLRVGVAAPFLLTQLFLPYFGEGASIVNLSSTRFQMSQPQTESYTAAKGGITALTHSLAISLAGKARVNAIAPGWISTTGETASLPDQLQHPVGRIGTPEDIVEAVLFLCSAKSGFITGQVLTIDGGMSRQMIYHGDNGWAYQP